MQEPWLICVVRELTFPVTMEKRGKKRKKVPFLYKVEAAQKNSSFLGHCSSLIEVLHTRPSVCLFFTAYRAVYRSRTAVVYSQRTHAALQAVFVAVW